MSLVESVDNSRCKQIRLTIDIIAQYLVCIGLFFLPVSTSLANMISVGAILSLFGQSFRERGLLLLKSSLLYTTLLLVILFFIGTLYTPYNFHTALYVFKKYAHKLVTFLILIPLFSLPGAQRRVINTIIFSALIFSVWAILQHAHIIRFDLLLNKKHSKIISEIPFSIYCAFALFFIQQRFFTERQSALHYGFLFSLIIFQLLYANLERTGLIITAFLLIYGLMTLKLTNTQKLRTAVIAISILFAAAFLPTIQALTKQVITEAKGYFDGKHHSSIGLRMAFTVNSVKLIKEKPLLGHGTGSFPQAYETTGGAKLPGVKTLGDPHQSYLHIAVQLGLVGLIAFLVWLLSHWLAAKQLPSQEKLLLRGLLMAFMLSCLSVSAFYRSRISTLYLTLAAVILGSGQRLKHTDSTND